MVCPLCSPFFTAESSKMLRLRPEKFLPSQESTQRIMNCLRQNSKVIGSERNTEKHMETGHTAPGRSFSQVAAVEKEPSLVEKAMPDGITKMPVREDITEVTGTAEELRMAERDKSSSITQPTVVAEKLKLGRRLAEEDDRSSISQPTIGSPDSVEIPDKNGRTTGAKRPRQPPSSTTSLPDYTEEQLNLFDFD